MANRGRQNKEGVQRFLSLPYLLIGGGAIVAVAVAVILFAALGSDSQPETTAASPAQDTPADTGSQEQSATEAKPVPAPTQVVSLVTLEEFGDFQCSHCAQFAVTIGKEIKRVYADTGRIKFVFRHFPFIGTESFRAAEATECAGDQGKFWEFHDIVFENWKGVNEGHYSDDNLKLFASSLRLDRSAFDSCFDSRKYLGKVQDDLRRGEQLGVQGTPTLFLDGKMLTPSSNEELVQLIESAIADAQ